VDPGLYRRGKPVQVPLVTAVFVRQSEHGERVGVKRRGGECGGGGNRVGPVRSAAAWLRQGPVRSGWSLSAVEPMPIHRWWCRQMTFSGHFQQRTGSVMPLAAAHSGRPTRRPCGESKFSGTPDPAFGQR